MFSDQEIDHVKILEQKELREHVVVTYAVKSGQLSAENCLRGTSKAVLRELCAVRKHR